jgi:amino acid transporter
MDNMGEAIAGYTFPWSTHFVGLAAVVTQNKLILFLMALSFILFNLWWVALSYLAFPRILFAWGMDRMGPKWFADIDYRWASPVKNHILCFILGEIGIAIYAFRGNPMEGLSVTGLEIVSIGVTAIAAALFRFRRRLVRSGNPLHIVVGKSLASRGYNWRHSQPDLLGYSILLLHCHARFGGIDNWIAHFVCSSLGPWDNMVLLLETA